MGAAVRGLALVALVLATGLVLAPLQSAAAAFGRRGWGRWPRPVCRVALALLRVRVVAQGAAVPAAPRLIAANHVSWLDILAVSSVEPVAFLAKSEVASWPLISRIAAERGTVFVERGRPRCIPAVNRAMSARLAAGGSLLLFPEGTTYDGSVVGPFRTSHLACLAQGRGATRPGTGHAVQPLAIRYSDPRAAWVGDAALVPHLWDVLRNPPVTAVLAYGPIRAVPHGFDRKALGRALREEVAGMVAGASPAPAPRRAPAGPVAADRGRSPVTPLGAEPPRDPRNG